MDAKSQLKDSDAQVKEIAKSLGFKTPTTFNRYFKTYTGITPQEYRNTIENKWHVFFDYLFLQLHLYLWADAAIANIIPNRSLDRCRLIY